MISQTSSDLIQQITACSPQTAADLLRDRTLADILRMSTDDLSAIFGNGSGPSPMTRTRALRLQAALQLALHLDRCDAPRSMSSASVAFLHYRWLRFESQEHLYAIGLSSSRHVMCETLIAKGAQDCLTFARPDIVRAVLRTEGAVFLLMVHNHPSGDPRPSSADDSTTGAVREMCKVCDIQFMDHLIIGFKTFYSYRANEGGK